MAGFIRTTVMILVGLCLFQSPAGVFAETVTIEQLMQEIRSGSAVTGQIPQAQEMNLPSPAEKPVEDKPVIDLSKAEVPAMPLIRFPHHQMARLKISDAEALSMGKSLYQGRCGSCHAVIPVRQFTKREWPGILTRMAPRATLRDEELAMISMYIEKDLQGPPQNSSSAK